MAAGSDEARVLAHVSDRAEQTIEEIRAAIRQPSVSRTGEGVQAMAEWVSAYLAALGADTRLAPGKHAPFVAGTLAGKAGAPRLLFYELYDVQPAAGQPGWSVDPFAGELVHDTAGRRRIVGRGAFNSKGPLVGALAAIRSFAELGIESPLAFDFLIEGEEEIGSPSLPAYIAANRAALQACDGAFIPYFGSDARGATTIRLGFKGLVLLEFRIAGGAWGGPARGDIHALHGAMVASPSWELVRALSGLVDAQNRLTVDGLSVPSPSAADMDLWRTAAARFDLDAHLAGLGARQAHCRMTREAALYDTMFACTLNIDAIAAGRIQGEGGPATAIPSVARAYADLRLLPGMSTHAVVDLIRAHLDRRGFAHVELSVRSSYPASRSRLDDPIVAALVEATRAHCADTRIVPIHAGAAPMYVFSETLGVPYVFGGVGHGAGSHGPDEYILADDVGPFMRSIVSFFYRYAENAGPLRR
ncbi:MAG: M20/M25/M40 family metallo-hydrolase [Tagaea sp.]|nr:M20/M25/M40 family metallo-hydrolase [Tagaea sp.]